MMVEKRLMIIAFRERHFPVRVESVAISVKQNLMDGNFGIFLFIGDSGDDTSQWGTRAIDVGSFVTFKGPLDTCQNCDDTKDQWIYGTIYLTDHVYDLFHSLRSGSPKELEPILSEDGRANPKMIAT